MRFAAAFLLVFVAGGIGPSTGFPQCFHVVAAQEDEPKPWMQGTVEIGCSRNGRKPGDQGESVQWKSCSCHHQKNPNGQCGDETDGRRWDPKCETRCSPKRCRCAPNPCDGTN